MNCIWLYCRRCKQRSWLLTPNTWEKKKHACGFWAQTWLKDASSAILYFFKFSYLNEATQKRILFKRGVICKDLSGLGSTVQHVFHYEERRLVKTTLVALIIINIQEPINASFHHFQTIFLNDYFHSYLPYLHLYLSTVTKDLPPL